MIGMPNWCADYRCTRRSHHTIAGRTRYVFRKVVKSAIIEVGETTSCIATVDEHKQTFEHYATKLQMTYAMRLAEGMEKRKSRA